VLQRDADSKWWSLTYLNPDPIPSPNGRFIPFISDADGWDHVYVVPSGGAVSQITRGRYEFVMYPGEFHYFHRAHVLVDAWRRVERFFDAHLREPGPTPSAGR
jgi:hypothetical protein